MEANKIVIIGDGEKAIKCYCFFTKYGFNVAFFISDTRKSMLFDTPVFKFSGMGNEKLAGLGCPIIFATTNPIFKFVVKRRLRRLGAREGLLIQHSYFYSSWMEKLIDSLSFSSKAFPNEYVKGILDNYPASGHDAVKTLAVYVSEKIKQDINNDQKTLGVFYPGAPYRENLGSSEMYDKIRQKGYNVVFLFGKICGDEFEKRPYSYYVGNGIIRYLDFIDIFIIPTIMRGLPERAKKVNFVHDIYDSPAGKITAPRKSIFGPPRESPWLDEMDYSFLPCDAVMPKNKISPDLISPYVRKKPYCCIPGGYMKLDSNLRYFENSKVPVDSIIYAPTVIGGEFAKYVSLPEYGEKIVGTLLDNFTDYKIIFRPHPGTLSTKYAANIVKRFSSNSRFVFDSNPSFYMDNYCRSRLMVTDMSGTAYTYAFTTLRPVVFFSHNEREVDKAFRVRYFPDRDKIGYVATTIDELREKVALTLEHIDELEEQVKEFRSSQMFNVGRAEDYFVENFHCIAEDIKNNDWQYVISPLSRSKKREISAMTIRRKVEDLLPLSVRLMIESKPWPSRIASKILWLLRLVSRE